MEKIICQSCGASSFTERGPYRICQYCGTKHSTLPSPSAPPANGVALDDDVQRLLSKCYADPKRAARYASLILDIDPTNEEALKFL